MSEFLGSIRADLTDRRLLPVVALVAIGLIAALAYALLGGSSGTAAPSASTGSGVRPTSGIAVNATTPEHAVAETTDGFKEQNAGKARDPFAQLPGAASGPSKAISPTTLSSTTSKSSSSTSSGGGSTSSTTTTETKTETKTEAAPKSKTAKTIYDVAIEFGTLATGVTPEAAVLMSSKNLKLQTPLPSATLPLLIFRGVTAKGKTATFTVVGEAILSGTGACLPSTAQCEAVDLKPGATEQLSYLAANGQTTVYELRVTGITPEKTKASTASAAAWAESKAGRVLLRQNGLESLPFLRYSSQPGVLVFAPRKASAARAHAAVISAAG